MPCRSHPSASASRCSRSSSRSSSACGAHPRASGSASAASITRSRTHLVYRSPRRSRTHRSSSAAPVPSAPPDWPPSSPTSSTCPSTALPTSRSRSAVCSERARTEAETQARLCTRPPSTSTSAPTAPTRWSTSCRSSKRPAPNACTCSCSTTLTSTRCASSHARPSPTSEMARAVFLDFYGTLAHARTWGRTREAVLAERGFRIPDDITERWTDEAADGKEHVEHSVDAETYRAWEHHRLRRFVEACGVGADDADLLVEDLYTATKSFELQAYPEVPAVLAELRERGVTVAVCSNWDWHLDRAMAQAGLDSLIDVLVTSARAGARKPHRRIFEYTLDACGIDDPSGVVFAGDS